ncbi:hypothetical protein ZWY2020_004740 [Hordeum vulgare]|nr:hypothetical protein ZWY2020_004740 [Hordeum vulgare]
MVAGDTEPSVLLRTRGFASWPYALPRPAPFFVYAGAGALLLPCDAGRSSSAWSLRRPATATRRLRRSGRSAPRGRPSPSPSLDPFQESRRQESPSPGIPSPAGYSTQGKKDPQPSVEGKIPSSSTAAPALSPPFSPMGGGLIRFGAWLGQFVGVVVVRLKGRAEASLLPLKSMRLCDPNLVDQFYDSSQVEPILTNLASVRNDLFTSAPIAQHYESLTLQDEDGMRAAVRHVASLFPTAIISGRSRDKVFDFVKLNELYYAGSHGMDIMGPIRKSESNGHHVECVRSTDSEGKEVNLFQPASEFLPMITEVFENLSESIKDIDGARMEDNKFCDYPCLRLTHGRKVLEVCPVIDWNKGKVVEFLLESLGLSESDDVLPIYVGDDKTDEDAFKVLKANNHGFGILVSCVPKDNDAFYSLRDPSEAPIRVHVSSDKFWMLTKNKAWTVPSPFDNKGNYVISLSQLVRWMSVKAEELGVEVYPGFAASEILYDENQIVTGVATNDVGIAKDGSKRETFQPGVELRGE